MTKTEFKKAVEQNGVYTASLFAAMVGIPMGVTQLWLKTL